MLPNSFISSLKGLPGFDEQAFIQTHALKESITSIRINTQKSFKENPSSFFEEASPIAWCADGFYLKDFVGREWLKYVDTIVDKNNMSNLDKEIYKHLLELHDKLHKLHLDKE